MVTGLWSGRLVIGLALIGAACSQPAAPAPMPAAPEAWGAGSSAQGDAQAALAGVGAEAGAPALRQPAAPGAFDGYLLALSWSPSFCAIPKMAARETLQCGGARSFAFVVHGLWPQNETGWPETCATDQPRDVAAPTVRAMLDLMPSPNLIQHQWDKHGTCSGLSPQDYFQQTRDFREKVRIPNQFASLEHPLRVSAAAIEGAFIAANRGLTEDAIAITCSRGRLREVRICFTREGEFRDCGRDVQERCGAEPLTLLPTRGG